MTTLRLYQFPHSHFCEVARWALDYKQLTYTCSNLLPGPHAAAMKRLSGATSVPVLQHADGVVAGASAIVDYLEQRYSAQPLQADHAGIDYAGFETDVARRIGVPLRRLCYAYLLARPDIVRHCFMHGSGVLKRVAFTLMYPLVRQRIRTRYNCTEDGAASARAELSAAFDDFDERLGERPFFFADQFTRADLSFAALGVFIVMPTEYPLPWPQALRDHALYDWFRAFSERPVYRHIARTYRTFRHHH